MNNSKTYSFIIPHHNTPDLLRRLIDSIPQREDIEVIVVDDNSDDDKKANVVRSDVRIFYIKKEETKGAGHARNVGMEVASGKWFLFADSDDFYDSSIESCLNVVNGNDDVDIFYFKVRGVCSDTLQSNARGTEYNNYVNYFLHGGRGAEDRIRFFYRVPWGKIFKSSFVKEGNYKFDETPTGNDMMFCTKTGAFANRIAVLDQPLYVVTSRNDSLTTRKDKIACRSRFEVKVRQNKFVHSIGKPYCSLPLIRSMKNAIRYFGLIEFFIYLFVLLKYRVNPLSVYHYRNFFDKCMDVRKR